MKWYLFLIFLHCSFPVYGDCKSTLNQLRSESKKIINTKEQSNDKESLLREKGFPETYIAGVNKTYEITLLKKKLEKIKADPKETHIPEFASQANSHIEKIEEGIRSQKEYITERLDLLEKLKKEAQNTMQEERVTYEWWIEFNFKLAILAESPDNLISKLKNNSTINAKVFRKAQIYNSTDVKDLYTKVFHNTKNYHRIFRTEYDNSDKLYPMIEKFPKDILFPIINDKLGVMAFNILAGTGAHILGLSERSVVTHNTKLSPMNFFLHDIVHSFAAFSFNPNLIALFDKAEKLPLQERLKFELIAFLITHEEGFRLTLNSLLKSSNQRSFLKSRILRLFFKVGISRNTTALMSPENLRNLLPENVNPNSQLEINKLLKEGSNILFHLISSPSEEITPNGYLYH